MGRGTAALNADRSFFPLMHTNADAPEVLVGRYYELHFDEIFIFVNSHVRRYEDSLDITHDVFAKALAFLQRSDNAIENPRAWLYRIARTVCIDKVYKKRKIKTEFLNSGDEHAISQPRAFENTILDQVMIDSVLEWVEKNTSEVERKIFELKILCGLTLAEVGETVSCDASTVSRVLSNLIERLKKEFI